MILCYDTNNDIYHFDLTNFSDSLFLEDYSHSDPVMSYFRSVKDYAFWDDDFSKYIFCGSMGSWEPGPYIKRFDSDYISLNFLCCEVNQIDISTSDDSLIYSGGWLDNGSSLRSNDGGFNWDTINESLKFVSLNLFNDSILFAFDNSDDLLRSSDGGSAFHLVDTIGNYNWDKFIYDIDEEHIYRTTFKYPFHFLIVSDNQGEAFSWETKYSSDSEIFISIDESTSGTIYLADKKNILISTDFGNNFSLYKTLERKIVGIYKKPNSDKLYAATKYKIYEITPDTFQVIKSLPVPQEVLNYYPLSIGNKWVFNEVTVIQVPPYYYDTIIVKEVFGDSIAPNGKNCYKVNDGTNFQSLVLERIDSTDGKVHRYYEDSSLVENEYVAYDLLAEVGDTLSSFRMGFNTVMFTTMIANSTFNNWGITRPKKVFEEYTLHPPNFSITKEFGVDSVYFYFDYGYTNITLKGCIIDGVVYGDTTTVGVEDEEIPIATSFKLRTKLPQSIQPNNKDRISDCGIRICDFKSVRYSRK